MARWLGLVNDPTAGGTTFDVLTGGGGLAIPKPSLWVPITTATVDAGLQQLNRNDENRGRRANVAPSSFASAPALSAGGRAYPKIINKLWAKVLGGAITSEGAGPKAITSKVSPLQTGSLPALVGWLLREEQLDRVTGAIISELAMSLPIEGDGTWTATLPSLFHDAQSPTEPKDPNGSASEAFGTPTYVSEEDSYKLRDCIAKRGAGETEIPLLAGVDIVFNNGMIEDMVSRFRPNHNIESKTVDEVLHKLWYPNKHKIGAQQVTGKITLSGIEAEAEAKHLLTHAEKLIIEVAAGPAGTTPPANQMIRMILSKHVLTGGGAEPLVREGDQRASFDFTAYLDEATNTDVETQMVAAAAVS